MNKQELKPLVDPNFHSLLNFPPPNFEQKWLIKALRVYGRLNWLFTKTPACFSLEKIKLKSANHHFTVEYYKNPSLGDKRPCLIYFHGGGFILPAFGYFKGMFERYSKEVGCDILFVDYTLSPEAKSKEVLQQCEMAYQWLSDNAQRVGVDMARIAVGGDSAGGALAASTAQILVDKYGKDSVCGQLLIYPVIDDSLAVPSIKEFYNSPVWSGEACEAMWPVYLDADKTYAVPMAREDVSDLPSAYVETAEFDPLRDDAIAYADRLEQSGVALVRNHTKKTVHGYDALLKGDITENSIKLRIAALKTFFAQ